MVADTGAGRVASQLTSKEVPLEPRTGSAPSSAPICSVCGDLGCGAQLSPYDISHQRASAGPGQLYLSLPQGPPSHPLTCAELKQLHLPLLELEHIAEIDRWEDLADLSQLGGLLVAGTELTPHGLRLWVLRSVGKDRRGATVTGRVLLPKHNIRAREPLEVTREGQEEFDATLRAVVYQVTDYEVKIVLNRGEKLTLDKMVDIRRVDDDRMYEKMRSIVTELEGISGRAHRLRAVLFGERPVESAEILPIKLINSEGGLQFYNTGLNRQQREAVEFAVRQKHLAVIHGPPGTGKTTTIVEIMLQHLKLGYRILASAHSNMAVDNMLERLAEKDKHLKLGIDMVRLGHPARIRDSLLDYWLDRVVETSGQEYSRQHDNKEAPLRNKTLEQRVIETAKVVLCTLSNTSAEGLLGPPRRLGIGAFDLVVIDECSQSVEAACWLAAQRTGKLLLAGDHRQLPPTILSEPAARRGLAVSLMERQVELHGAAAVRMLCTQYRMHELIQQWPSERHYDGRLEAAPGVRFHRLPELPGVRETADTAPTLLLIDTAGCRLTESRPDEAGSKRNDGEADIVAAHVAALVGDGVLQEQIGVITPYRAQITRVRAGLRQRYLEEVDVHTVDGFQGREKEAIVVSLVISRKGGLKFVADKRRINVAITRARRQLVIVCDTKMMSRDDDMQSLFEYMRQHGEVRTAHEYVNELSAAALARYRPGRTGYGMRRIPRHPDDRVMSMAFNRRAPPTRSDE